MIQPRAAWLVLVLILCLYLLYLGYRRPADLFGWYHDDTIYFSSAQSLSQGRGYGLPSLPGPVTPEGARDGNSPAPTKYPVLYPWLLSWIWRWNPSFPANVVPAVWMTALFACWFLLAASQMLRKLRGVGEWPAVMLVGLTAFQPHFVFLSGAVLSDVPFIAFALSAAVAADAALAGSRGPNTMLMVLAAVLAGLSVLTRGFGIAVVAGIVAFALYRRAFRQAAVFCLAAVPFLVFLFWSAAPAQALDANAGDDGWRQTWLFYTSYGQFWKLSVPSADVLLAMLSFNLRTFLEWPASYCLFPPLGDGSYLGIMLCITLSAGILAGIVRQARSDQWRSIHFIFPLYSAMTLAWNYTLMDRFLMLFVPLFWAGLWVEGKHFSSMLLENLRSARSSSQRILAGALGLGLLAVGWLAMARYARGFRVPSAVVERNALVEEKNQLYEWIRRNTDHKDRFVAYEDVTLYLQTGRQAIRAIAFSTAAFYILDEKLLARDLAHITDVARRVGARYWVASEDDFHLETGLPLIERRMQELKTALPVVFQSQGNKVQVYDLSCLHQPNHPGCEGARLILSSTSPAL